MKRARGAWHASPPRRACAWSAAALAAPDAGPLPSPPANAVTFTPPDETTIPNSPLGDMIRFGSDVFVDTQRYAKQYVGNGLNCVNCHLDAGRKAEFGPLWAAYVAYPAFRDEDEAGQHVCERLDGCFRYSMNGRMPPLDDAVIVALTAYSFWLATGAPVGAHMAGRGFPEVASRACRPTPCAARTYSRRTARRATVPTGRESRPAPPMRCRRCGAAIRTTPARACTG